MDTIRALEEVCDVLTRDALTPAAARDALSRSSAEWVRGGEVVAAHDASEPNHVELRLPAPVALDAFEQAFGDGHPAPPLHPGSTTDVLYYPTATADRTHSCAIIARLSEAGVRTVAVRRDPTL